MIIEFWKTGENPITCYTSLRNKSETLRVPFQGKKINTQPVMVEYADGRNQKFESVVEAAFSLKITSNTLYNILNGKSKALPELSIYKLEKSKINQ